MCIAACIKKKPIKVQRGPSTWLAHLTLHGAADMAGACFGLHCLQMPIQRTGEGQVQLSKRQLMAVKLTITRNCRADSALKKLSAYAPLHIACSVTNIRVIVRLQKPERFAAVRKSCRRRPGPTYYKFH